MSIETGDLYKDNDIPIIVAGMYNTVSGVSVTDATVTAKILDSALAQLGVDIDCAYDSVTDRYVGVIEASTALVVGDYYRIDVTASNVSGFEANWRTDPMLCKYRSFFT